MVGGGAGHWLLSPGRVMLMACVGWSAPHCYSAVLVIKAWLSHSLVATCRRRGGAQPGLLHHQGGAGTAGAERAGGRAGSCAVGRAPACDTRALLSSSRLGLSPAAADHLAVPVFAPTHLLPHRRRRCAPRSPRRSASAALWRAPCAACWAPTPIGTSRPGGYSVTRGWAVVCDGSHAGMVAGLVHACAGWRQAGLRVLPGCAAAFLMWPAEANALLIACLPALCRPAGMRGRRSWLRSRRPLRLSWMPPPLGCGASSRRRHAGRLSWRR